MRIMKNLDSSVINSLKVLVKRSKSCGPKNKNKNSKKQNFNQKFFSLKYLKYSKINRMNYFSFHSLLGTFLQYNSSPDNTIYYHENILLKQLVYFLNFIQENSSDYYKIFSHQFLLFLTNSHLKDNFSIKANSYQVVYSLFI